MKAYLESYENFQEDIRHIPLNDYPNRGIWTTWNISYAAISDTAIGRV